MKARALTRALLMAMFAAVPGVMQAAGVPAEAYATRPDVRTFIAELVAKDGFDAVALRRLFAQVREQPKVVAAMSRPLLAPPKWYEYAPQFLYEARSRRRHRVLARERRRACPGTVGSSAFPRR